MRKLVILALAFFLLMPLASAKFEVSVLASPKEWVYNSTEKVGVVVINDESSTENLTMLEILVPTENQTPLYSIKDDFTLPPAWTYSLSYREGKVYKITFISSKGLEPGKDTVFLMNSVTSPKIGEYRWKWKATSSENKSISGNLTTYSTFGKLKEFKLKNVPEEVRAKESFEVTITAYDEFGNIKEDYEGKITITSSDKKALFPQTYQFKAEDKGVAKIKFAYRTTGEQYFSIVDEKEKVSATSLKTLVLPAIPLKLSIKINNDVLSTTSKWVNLTLYAEGAKECKYSNDGVIWTDYEPYSETKQWELIEGEGTRIVYYQCRNEEGESQIVYDTIELKARVSPFSTISAYLALILSVIAIIISIRRPRLTRKKEE